MMPTLERPFPWQCPTCGERSIYRATISHSLNCVYEEQTYNVQLPAFAVLGCEK
jgi:uncharacterized protein (DUF983 family)